MKNRMVFALIALALFFVATPAMAAGPYVGAQVGAVFLSDSTFSIAGIDVGDAKFDTGFGFGLAGGFDYGTWRLEGEFAYRVNDNKEVTYGGTTDPIGGDISSMALMVNGYYDFKTVSPTFVPYLGVGVGGAQVSAKVTDPIDGTVIDDSDTGFAYQFAAGVGIVASKQLTIDLGYKYFATTEPSFEVLGGGGIKMDAEYGSHNLFLGARYSF